MQVTYECAVSPMRWIPSTSPEPPSKTASNTPTCKCVCKRCKEVRLAGVCPLSVTTRRSCSRGRFCRLDSTVIVIHALLQRCKGKNVHVDGVQHWQLHVI
eukprot:750093-Amphidinium_carterae.3